MRTKIKLYIKTVVASLVLAVAGMGGTVFATQPDQKVTICHRTKSTTNPYTVNSVGFDSTTGELKDKGNGDHTGHTGAVFNPNTDYPTPHNGDQWGDIIPPYTWDGGGHYDGLNWTAEGQAVYNNGGCDGVYTPPTGGSGGENPSTPGTVLGAVTQVTTVPQGAVNAGAGSAVELSPAAITGLGGSVLAVVAGIALSFKRRLQ